MRTSREAYNRIIWDPRLDRTAFVIGYRDRQANGVVEKPLTEWQANGDIPWHRIAFIRCGPAQVWSRAPARDALNDEELPPEAWLPAAAVAEAGAAFTPRPVFRHGANGWEPIPDDAPLTAARVRLTVATFNVLREPAGRETAPIEGRIPLLLHELRRCQADLIALQEVSRPLLEALLAQEWARALYVSAPPGGGDVPGHGLVFLARLPFRLTDYAFTERKRVLLGQWEINGQPLRLVNVHLPSNRTPDAANLRAGQLATIRDHLAGFPGDVGIVGDFNASSEEVATALPDFRDAWPAEHPDGPGHTFDPERNALAARATLTGEPHRPDRLLLRGDGWNVSRAQLFATQPNADGLFPSDHFALRVTLEARNVPPLHAIPPVYETAVCLIPGGELWPPIQFLRRRFDRKVDRWMPHINLLYGFLPEAHFDEALPRLREALAGLEPFQVTLKEYRTFLHPRNCTAWLHPVTEPPGRLHQLYDLLVSLFPQCDEQGTKSAEGFIPHLSVGQFANPKIAHSKLPPWRPGWFNAHAVAVISRRGNEPFEVRHLIPLGRQTSPHPAALAAIVERLEPRQTPEQQAQREAFLEDVRRTCTAAVGRPIDLKMLGSERLGVAGQGSDLDVVCVMPPGTEVEPVIGRLEKELSACRVDVRRALDARVPVLRMKRGDLGLDLLPAVAPEGPWELGFDSREKLDPVSWMALSGCLEADVLELAVQAHVPLDAFRFMLRAVRAWARARQVVGNAWGFPGSYTWAVLAAWAVTSAPDPSDPGALLAHFFRALHRHHWRQPVGLTRSARAYKPRIPPDWLPVVCSLEPCFNTARNVKKSTLKIVRREFSRAAHLAADVMDGKATWEDVFAPAVLAEQAEQFVIITLTSNDPAVLSDRQGRMEGQIIGLVLDYEKRCRAQSRPWPKAFPSGNQVRSVLGIHFQEEPDLEYVRQQALDFLNKYVLTEGMDIQGDCQICGREGLAIL